MTPRLKVSQAGLELIKGFEGYRRKAIRLASGQWTVGYGHTKSARDGVDVAPEDAEALLLYDLQDAENAINDWVLAPLTQHQFDALLSFAYNIGLDAFRRSAVLRRLNEGRVLQAACAMELWRKARVDGDDIVVDALVRRRASEKALFLTPPGGSVAAPSSEIRPEPDFSVQAAVPRETPRELDLGLDTVVMAPEPVDMDLDLATSAAKDVEVALQALHIEDDGTGMEFIPVDAPKGRVAALAAPAERLRQPYPMELTDKPSRNVVQFPDAAMASGASARAAAVLEAERPLTLAEAPVIEPQAEVVEADVPQTSPEEILDIVRRIREMTEAAPAPVQSSVREVAVESPVAMPTPVAAPVAEPAPAAVAKPVVVEDAAEDVATVAVAAPVLFNEAPVVAPVLDPQNDPLGKPMVAGAVKELSPDTFVPVVPAPAPKPIVRDTPIDPDSIVIPEEGLAEPMFSGEEVFDLRMVHEAPPISGKDNAAVFLGDSKSMYVMSMGILGVVMVIIGFLGMGAEHPSFMTSTFPLMLGVLCTGACGYLVFQKYQQYKAHHA